MTLSQSSLIRRLTGTIQTLLVNERFRFPLNFVVGGCECAIVGTRS